MYLLVEKWLHLLPISFGTATAAWVLDLYNAANCWIAPLPENCTSTYTLNHGNTDLTKTDCIRGNGNANIYHWTFSYLGKWATIAFCVVAMFL
jgi:hypothetical protein